jgi:hypothetical protein
MAMHIKYYKGEGGGFPKSKPWWILCVATLVLGSRPKQGLAKVQAKSEAWGSHFMLLGVQESVKEWTPTFPSELPLWKLESQWILESSEGHFKSQNSLDWKVFHTMKKFLKHKCLKWARMTHLGTSNINHGQKKGRESKCQFDFRPLKVKNRLNFLACKWCATYHWKYRDKGYNFALDLTSIKRLNAKVWAYKVAGVLI